MYIKCKHKKNLWKDFNEPEDVESETQIDIKFLQKVVVELVKKLGITFAGFDFIVSNKDGS